MTGLAALRIFRDFEFTPHTQLKRIDNRIDNPSRRFNMRKADNPYYLRDSKGHEVDVLLDYGSYVDMIEIKSSQTLAGDLFNGLKYFRNVYPQTRNCSLV